MNISTILLALAILIFLWFSFVNLAKTIHSHAIPAMNFFIWAGSATYIVLYFLSKFNLLI